MISELLKIREQKEILENALDKLKADESKLVEKIVSNSMGAKTIRTDEATVTITDKIYSSIKGGYHDTPECKKLAELIRQTGFEHIERLDYISDAKLSDWCKQHPDSAIWAKDNGLINIEVKNKITVRKKK